MDKFLKILLLFIKAYAVESYCRIYFRQGLWLQKRFHTPAFGHYKTKIKHNLIRHQKKKHNNETNDKETQVYLRDQCSCSDFKFKYGFTLHMKSVH